MVGCVEVDRVVPPSGNMSIRPQQFWLGTRRTGERVRFWIDTTTVHLSIGGWRIKTVPSRLSAVDLARAATNCVEVQRLVNSSGIISLGNQVIAVGSPLAGQRARVRLDGQVMHVVTQDGILWRTLPCRSRPPSGTSCRVSGLRGPSRSRLPAPLIQRKVSSRGAIQVARQRV